ncbi:Lumazine-binding protein [Parasponia andersonii]|uniref:Riboflavin synthase n=1 Tax=Parasponia andersonii TaxID=3476 RepID=A0A2P5ARX4_PARAD|nr:Lumazine-binding protein [Parasponia andersonii]
MSLPFRLSVLCKTPKTPLQRIPVLSNRNAIPPKAYLRFNPFSGYSTLTLFVSNPKPRNHPTISHPPNAAIRCLFTGIVEEMGQIKQLGIAEHGGFDMKIGAKTVLEGVNLGDSIAVNGTCLTVTQFDTQLSEFTVGLSPETLRKTSLAELSSGSLVNLERAMQPISRMGGHFVQGHVDGTGEIVSMEPEGDSLWIKVKAAKEVLKYVVPKGFIAVDGTSLTVVDVFDEEACFNFMLVAYTQLKVVIPLKKVGQKVNLEVDILGKYVERILGSKLTGSINSS